MFNTAVLPFLADAGASGGDWISGQTLVAILSAIFGGTVKAPGFVYVQEYGRTPCRR